MLELLILKGCDINAKNKESLFMRNFYLTYSDFQMGIGALAAASASGKIEMARKLLVMECLVTDTDYVSHRIHVLLLLKFVALSLY